MRAALDYASRRYRVSAEALVPIFAATQLAARDLRVDPLLIIAVIGIESSFNPFSESAMGAQGLMQVIPRYHRDKLPDNAGRLHLFDPVANIQVGTQALYEYIRRNGDIVGGLQQFAGDPGDPDQAYAAKVLAEKERLESAALHRRGS
jgi:soluble lytic murein transglycosylase-like protein